MGSSVQINSKKEQTTATAYNILAEATKLKLARYYHAALFVPTKINLLKDTNKYFLEKSPVLNESLTNKHLDKYISNKMNHPHMNRQ